jgi:hypothetical protein
MRWTYLLPPCGGVTVPLSCAPPRTRSSQATSTPFRGESCVRAFACWLVGGPGSPVTFFGSGGCQRGSVTKRDCPEHQPHPDKPHTRGSPHYWPLQNACVNPTAAGAGLAPVGWGGRLPRHLFRGGTGEGKRLQKGDRKRPKVWVRSVKLRGYVGGSSEKGDSWAPGRDPVPEKGDGGERHPNHPAARAAAAAEGAPKRSTRKSLFNPRRRVTEWVSGTERGRWC